VLPVRGCFIRREPSVVDVLNVKNATENCRAALVGKESSAAVEDVPQDIIHGASINRECGDAFQY